MNELLPKGEGNWENVGTFLFATFGLVAVPIIAGLAHPALGVGVGLAEGGAVAAYVKSKLDQQKPL